MVASAALAADEQPASASASPAADAAATQPENHWVVNLSSHLVREKAEEAVKGLQQLGVTSSIKVVLVNGQEWYRVYVAGFDHDGARAYLNQHKSEAAFEGAWIGRDL
ncbi:SPOR domain-containing protein [Mariprofundus erugo]|nr:SPOR domain-containing protein [Mariprofundus erugo]